MKINYEKIPASERYGLMSQSVVPRPIAWIVTEHNGVINIAPFSYFTPLSSEPATLIVSIGHKKDGSPKDTLANIRDSKRCTISMVPNDFLKSMHYTSKSFERDVSEAKEFNIPLKEVFDGYPPMIKGTPTAFACELLQEVELEGKTKPIILEIKAQYLDEKCILDPEYLYLDCTKLIGRIGSYYAEWTTTIMPPEMPS